MTCLDVQTQGDILNGSIMSTQILIDDVSVEPFSPAFDDKNGNDFQDYSYDF